MHINIKSIKEIENMRIAGQLAGKVLDMIEPFISPGITTEELDNICHDYIIQQHAIPACLGYFGFPKSTCISVNNVVCHGIPNNHTKLKDGDIVNIDVTILKNQYHADTSKMFIIGTTNIIAQNLCNIAKKSLYLTFPIIKPYLPFNMIGKTIQKYIDQTPFSIVKEYCGHGIGKKFHEEPYILHYNNNYNTMLLKEGMVFTIEPIINAGKEDVVCMDDKWTICTKDHSLSAQYEHTILVTKTGCEILTKRPKEKIKNIYINI